ncbi:hypothetical protein ATO6_21385 [Oceanicola sp. 22II-s10i]|uniref:amidohydrolase family protein n=1 Tax=Oceanicola sp. 22II-s10i TaxID=1317116 RepID=UPI000B51F203|nr:amidohydrolase family protein [Oceanicola sp. 22II-s10i]OWU82867.1 hypothetical protein ATO6_21385 [Oceanicola sp. 22II-s10i]
MLSALPALRLTGAHVLRDGALRQRSVAVAEGLFTRGPLPVVDMSGYLVLPGIVDMNIGRVGVAWHGRADRVLREAGRAAAAAGVTTGHLVQGWSWASGAEAPEQAAALASALARTGAEGADLRLTLRCETHTVETATDLLALAGTGAAACVAFVNTLDDALATASTRPEDFAVSAACAGRSAEAHMDRIRTARKQQREVPRHLCRLAEAFDRLGIIYGSHGDPDGETRETFSMIGAKVCGDPASRAAAALARAVGDPVVLSADGLARGEATQQARLAMDLMRDGHCDALMSGDSGPCLAAAAFRLSDVGVMPLQEAWALISTRPAEILRLPDRGRIAPGRRADLVAIHAESRRIELTLSGGRITHLSGQARERLMAADLPRTMAAE